MLTSTSWGPARKPPASIHISYPHSPIPFACGTIQYARAGCARRPPAEGFLLLGPTKHGTPGPHHKRPRDMSPHRLHDRARLRLPPHVERSLLANRTGATKPSRLQPKPKRLPRFNPPIPSPLANRVVLTLTRTMFTPCVCELYVYSFAHAVVVCEKISCARARTHSDIHPAPHPAQPIKQPTGAALR